jgi:TM2 domain-containing membrane protein YozV
MKTEFYIVWKGQRTGPFSQLEIQGQLLSGQITPLHVVLDNEQPIDHLTWLNNLQENARQQQLENERKEITRIAQNEQLLQQQLENQRLQRELEEAQRRAALPPPPPPPPRISRNQPFEYQNNTSQAQYSTNPVVGTAKSRVVYVLLALFLGFFGIHNFYAGYTGKAVAQLLICLFVGWLILPILALFIWVIVEMISVTHDAKGVQFT